MNELVDLIRHALRDGLTVKIEINLKRDTAPQNYTVECKHCDWSGTYSTHDSAQRALRAHHQHCPKYAEEMHWIAAMQNGTSHDE